ncbi:MAG TPA: hypothetical protein VLA19_27080, partial [Herpetosiphonaceae bacterium]|nr:hypothetical protein [Herpetosiphonaceae bacterium]
APSPTPVPTAGATQTTLPPVAQTAQPQAASATSGSPVAQSAAAPVVTVEPATVPLPTAAPSVAPAPPPPGPTPEGGAAALVFQLGPALNVLDTRQGSGVQISANADSRGPAAISPDGNSILFDAAEGGEQRHIFRFDRAANRVEAWSRGEGDFYQPAWMPDGNQVTFVSTRDGNAEIYLTDVDGGRPERLTTDPAQDEYPSWSPDGSLVIWESRRDEGWQIWTMNQDGQRRPVEPVPGRDDRYPRISPDGTQVVFASNRDRTDDGLEIYVQSLDGGLPRRLTSFETGSALGPQWSPDGRMIVFWSDAEGNQDIYTLRLADGEIKRFGDSPGDERWPVWGR